MMGKPKDTTPQPKLVKENPMQTAPVLKTQEDVNEAYYKELQQENERLQGIITDL